MWGKSYILCSLCSFFIKYFWNRHNREISTDKFANSADLRPLPGYKANLSGMAHVLNSLPSNMQQLFPKTLFRAVVGPCQFPHHIKEIPSAPYQMHVPHHASNLIVWMCQHPYPCLVKVTSSYTRNSARMQGVLPWRSCKWTDSLTWVNQGVITH